MVSSQEPPMGVAFTKVPFNENSTEKLLLNMQGILLNEIHQLRSEVQSLTVKLDQQLTAKTEEESENVKDK